MCGLGHTHTRVFAYNFVTGQLWEANSGSYEAGVYSAEVSVQNEGRNLAGVGNNSSGSSNRITALIRSSNSIEILR